MASLVDVGTRIERPSSEAHGRSRFDEIELRRMLEHAGGHRPDILEGRFVIELRHVGVSWEVIVEADEWRQLLVVITAYSVDQLQRSRELTRGCSLEVDRVDSSAAQAGKGQARFARHLR